MNQNIEPEDYLNHEITPQGPTYRARDQNDPRGNEQLRTSLPDFEHTPPTPKITDRENSEKNYKEDDIGLHPQQPRGNHEGGTRDPHTDSETRWR